MISRTVADLVEKNKGIKSELFPDPGYEIIDNYIPEDELKKIQDLLILNHQFPWFRSHTVAWTDTVKDDITPEHLSYFGHILYGNFNERDRNANTSRSEYFEPLYNILMSSLQPIKSLLRIKVNLYPFTETLWEHAPHFDWPFPHYLGVFMVNDCDGYTKLNDGTKIDSIANRLLITDGSILHSSTTTTNDKVRVTIGMNWL